MPNYRKSEGFAAHHGFGVFGRLVAPHLKGTANPSDIADVASWFGPPKSLNLMHP
jgi:hypothetical protein